MTRQMSKFDVHRRTGSELTGFGIGELLYSLDTADHRTAKRVAEAFAEREDEFPVVVVPHRKPNEKLERACARLQPRPTFPDRGANGRRNGRSAPPFPT